MSDDARQTEYVSPFSARYASPEMSRLFSAHYKISVFRKLWISLATAQKKLGLPITNSQIAAMKKASCEIDWAKAREYEKKMRHDVMAHIHAYGDLCPTAKPIIHLGATSTYVTDNGDLIQMKEALQLLHQKLVHVLRLLAAFTKAHARFPCLGLTHYQSAQPTTIGKRAALWLQDFFLDAQEWERLIAQLPFLGAKGATGTQSSFLSLFQGDVKKVVKLEALIAKDFGFTKVLPISGQTYSRKLDLNILNALESFAASAHKMATDIRLLSHDGELAEGFSKTQVGSSAMPHKRNPIYSERICGIARFVMSLAQNPAYTMATQWCERTLDDSSNKRLSIPEAFLGTDAILNLLAHLLSSLTVFSQTALSRLKVQIPYLAMENILMAAVNKGGDRQALHEKLRQLSTAALKKRDPLKFLLSAIEKESAFQLERREIQPLLSLSSLTGLAEEQTIAFLEEEIGPYLSQKKKIKAFRPAIET
jgi:adenylosuccinate lyase